MTIPNESGPLSDAESADLTSRVERFRSMWSPDDSTDLSYVLPPRGERHRLAVLVQVVRADMELRAAARLAFRVERYVNMFPDDLTSQSVPAAILETEYRLRHQYTDRPDLAEYQRWFPDQYDAIAEALQRDPVPLTGTVAVTRVSAAPGVTRVSSVPVLPPRPADPSTLNASDVLPSDVPYRLIRKLGSGAFGEVFEARAPGEIPVAVKRIMRPSDHPSSKSERAALEAIKRFSHPFLLKTNAYWILDDRLVIVMDLADGSLADRMEFHQKEKRPGVPPEELIPLFEQAAEALDYLHAENVSHRDIKPENILIQKGYAKVADFGLARPQEHTMTVVGGTAGTPAYMAPEMWQERVSLQSDQYSLAATYFRARTGRTLFQTTILVDMANCHLHETPDLNPLPEDEQAVLHKALSKNPNDRYASCLEFAQALKAAVFPPPPPPEPVVVTETKRGPTALIGAAVALAVVAVVLAVAFRKGSDPTNPDGNANTNNANKQDEPKPLPIVSFAEWAADPAEKTIDGKRYPVAFTRKVGDDTLTAVLIEPTPKGLPNQPPPFYMLKHKLSNRVFAQLWDEVEKDPNSALRDYTQPDRDALVKEHWKDGAVDYGPKPKNKRLGIAGEFADAPVLGVTVPEAMLVAQKLGGSLPTFNQWRKATGAMEPEPRELPAGKRLGEELEFKPDEAIPLLAARELALGRERPMSVGYGKDVSYRKIVQLVSNGFEWLCHSTVDETKRTPLSPPPPVNTTGLYVGMGYYATKVMDWVSINAPPQTTNEINDTAIYAGVRVVLNP